MAGGWARQSLAILTVLGALRRPRVDLSMESGAGTIAPSGRHGVKQTWLCFFLCVTAGRFLHPFWVAAPSFVNEDHSRTPG